MNMIRKWACLFALLMLLPVFAMAQSAVVDNGSDPSSYLNMRSAPSRDAQVVGKFVSGTPVEILRDAGDGWSEVCIGAHQSGVTGYMMTNYLKPECRVDATERRQVVSPYGTQSVVLRSRPSNSYDAVAMLMVGDVVTVVGSHGDFCYVITADACAGCLAVSELK